MLKRVTGVTGEDHWLQLPYPAPLNFWPKVVTFSPSILEWRKGRRSCAVWFCLKYRRREEIQSGGWGLRKTEGRWKCGIVCTWEFAHGLHNVTCIWWHTTVWAYMKESGVRNGKKSQQWDQHQKTGSLPYLFTPIRNLQVWLVQSWRLAVSKLGLEIIAKGILKTPEVYKNQSWDLFLFAYVSPLLRRI